VTDEPLRSPPFAYLDRWSVRAGEKLHLKASSAEDFTVRVVRLLHADVSADGPGRIEEEQSWCEVSEHPALEQRILLGSFASSTQLPALSEAEVISVSCLTLTRLPAAGARQTVLALVSRHGEPWLSVGLGPKGEPLARVATPRGLVQVGPEGPVLPPSTWLTFGAEVDLAANKAFFVVRRVAVAGREATDRDDGASLLHQAEVELGPHDARQLSATRAERLVLAALSDANIVRASPDGGEHFTGKIEGPRVDCIMRTTGSRATRSYGWDLSQDIGQRSRRSDGAEQATLRMVNGPTDAVTGHSWSGRVTDFRLDATGYGAVAFHADDLEDARWETTRAIELPAGLASGTYAVKLASANGARYVPFFVVPGEHAKKARIALLMPTLTYQAYANDHVRESVEHFQGPSGEMPGAVTNIEREIVAHPELGLSVYDRHLDGSGVCYSSLLRPVLNLSPDHRLWLLDAPCHLPADLYISHWLDYLGQEFDVITDHELDRVGPALLASYSVVLTGSHPEYVTASMIDALEAHVAGGGVLMYLGGNGHYWVTSIDPERPHVIEVRRGFAGSRVWESEPGEEHHSSTGERGGLWRHRGRPPNHLLGVGFAAQGWGWPAPGYRRVLPEGSSLEWVFNGVDDEGAIGETGLVLGGAAGNEVDRADPSRGTPEAAVVLATSKGHSDLYQLAHEDILLTSPGQGGTTQPLVRSDVVLVPHRSGGWVFSVGAITWTGSLSWNGYQNDVARITGNVLVHALAATADVKWA
jgi:N,N-dimethylformamidase